MRKYKQVKEKKVIYSLDEWKQIEERSASVMMKTGTFIRRMSLDGQIIFCNVSNITQLMNALRIIGGNINQIAKKANETHSVHAEDVAKLQKEVVALSRTLSQSVVTAPSNTA